MTDENIVEADGETEKFLWEVHKYTNDYIRFADTKAAFIAGVSTALIGSLVASSIFDSVTKMGFCEITKMQWAGFVGLVALTASLGLSIAAIRPRLWNNTSVGYIFWGSVVGHKTAKQFTLAVNGLSKADRASAVSDHLFVLASIAKRKYSYVDHALIAGTVRAIFTGFVLFMQHARK